MIDAKLMAQELRRDEGVRLTVYDDATGDVLKPGMTLKGHPTIGVGRALDVRGITPVEADYLLYQDIAAIQLGLSQRYTWFSGLDDVRQRVLVNMAFNLGLDGISYWRRFLECLAVGAWDAAAGEMLTSKWYGQVKVRAVRLITAMRTGVMEQ